MTITGGTACRCRSTLRKSRPTCAQERYRQNGYNFLQKSTTRSAAQRLVLPVAAALRVGVRKHLQKVRLSGWDKIPFPRWPVDGRSMP